MDLDRKCERKQKTTWRTDMKTIAAFYIFALFAVAGTSQAWSQNNPLPESEETNMAIDEEFKWLQEEAATTFVVTASRVKEDIRKSAASITVITDEQIRKMGARHLTDVLQTVPGISCRYSSDGNYKIDIRGMTKTGGQDVLIMVNSHPLNENSSGGATLIHDTIVVDNIRRIEVIRGPGSAMYGANAFAGVVNIITKHPEDIDGYQINAKAGSDHTQQYNLLIGKTYKNFGISLNVNYFRTDGYKPYMREDAQTGLDQLFGTSASYAPGCAETDDEKYDIALTFQYKGLKLDGRYVDREKKPAMTPGYTINHDSVSTIRDYYLNLSYETAIGEHFEILGKIYRNYNDYSGYNAMPKGRAILMPDPQVPGRVIPFIMSEGLQVDVSNKNSRTGAELQATCKVSDSNTVVTGMTYEYIKPKLIRFAANFLYTPVPGVFIPLSSVQDLTDTQNYDTDIREFKAFFIQDIWDITKDIRLTAGARYDDYSDFGSSFNPRVGITWEFIKDCDVKLLYGRAFRAPTYQELYTKKNPAMTGNPDLNPEKVDTYEISLGAMLSDRLNARITGFRNDAKDNITLVSVGDIFVFDNSEELRFQGVETEIKYDFGKGSYLAMNYTYQDAENLDTNERPYNIPKHKGNITANIALGAYVNFHTGFHFQRDFKRQADDAREDNPGFGIVNAALTAKNFFKGLEVRGAVYNLLDKEYASPTGGSSLPDDFPMPGRSFLLELQYQF
jgi:iron complex outermembrane receptor protein